MKFDVPGDIHGQDGNLDTLLAKLGYAKAGGYGLHHKDVSRSSTATSSCIALNRPLSTTPFPA
jgi:hypothetical protein